MKRVLVLCFILFSFSSVFSKNLINKIQDLTLEIDSLPKQVIKPKYDSILELQSKNILLDEKKQLISNDSLLTLSNLKLNLSKDTIKVEKDRLQEKVDSLSKNVEELEDTISKKDAQFEEAKKIYSQNLIAEREKGRQEILNQIIITYHKPFDELIKSSTIRSVKRDLSIVGNNTEVQHKLMNLQKYFIAEQVLSKKYNEQKVNSALTQIDSLDQTELVKNLTDILKKYNLRNEGLKITINNIIEIKKQLTANDDDSQEKKLEMILFKFAWYFRNYRFNFYDYPYLSDIVLEIIKQKQKDANTDISNYLDEL